MFSSCLAMPLTIFIILLNSYVNRIAKMTSSLTKPLKKMQRKEELEQEFMASGEQERIEEIVIRRLQESGWTRKVEDMCKDYITKKGCERVELQTMVDELRDASRRIVPDDVKRELMQLIQEFVNSRTEIAGNQN